MDCYSRQRSVSLEFPVCHISYVFAKVVKFLSHLYQSCRVTVATVGVGFYGNRTLFISRHLEMKEGQLDSISVDTMGRLV